MRRARRPLTRGNRAAWRLTLLRRDNVLTSNPLRNWSQPTSAASLARKAVSAMSGQYEAVQVTLTIAGAGTGSGKFKIGP